MAELKTEVCHVGHFVTHVMNAPEEDVEARLIIPGRWHSESKEYVLLVIRHGIYITISKLVETAVGRSMLNVVDAYYPVATKKTKKGRIDAKTAYQGIIELLTEKPFTSNQAIQKVTAPFRTRQLWFIHERNSAFADLTMDFEIIGPILDYCDDAIDTFQFVTGEVTPDGRGDPCADTDTIRQQPSSGDVDQNRSENQKE